MLHPPPPSSVGMLVECRPSSWACLACPAATSGGSSPPSISAWTSNGISSSAKLRARDWMARSSSDNPYTLHSFGWPGRATGRHRNDLPILTECSVYASIGLVPMPSTGQLPAADVVVVGGGTVGAWCAYFLRRDGLRVTLIEKGLLGQGASSRAAGVVRAQGGTAEAVQLAHWTQRFYLRQRDELGIDSGFTAQGYLLPCFTEAEAPVAHQRMARQNSLASTWSGSARTRWTSATRRWPPGRRWA